MDSHLHDITLIQSYLDRSLSAAEKEKLEKRLKEEPLLKNMYIEQQQLISGIRYSHLKQKLEQLRTLEASLPVIKNDSQEKQIFLQRYWKPLAAAASISIILVTYIFLNRSQDPAELYASYFEAYPNVFEPIVRGENEAVTKRSAAFQAYESKDYAQAANLFSELLKEKKEPGMLLLLGNANLILNNTKEARNNFIMLINDFEEYDIQGKWYLGLSYLKEGDVKSAQLIMRELSNSEYSYAGKAKELLKKAE